MADAIRSRLNGGSGWDVFPLLWLDDAATLLPATALNNAFTIGVAAGDEIYDRGYRDIHLIGHSAGSGLLHNAIARVRQREAINSRPAARIHATFLDAYVGIDGQFVDYFGRGATWADQYVVDNWGTGTDAILTNAFNFSVTRLDPLGGSDPLFVGSHGYPHQFYLETIQTSTRPARSFFDYGFPLSVEGGGWRPTFYELGDIYNLYRLVDGSIDIAHGWALSIPKPPKPPRRPALDFSLQPDVAVSHADAVGRTGTRLDLQTTSAAWVALAVPIGAPTNSLSMKVTLAAPAGRRGQLSLYWNNVLLGAVDSRFVLDGPNARTFTLPGEFASGSHILAVRLDAADGATLHASIDDVVTGHGARTH